MDRAAEKAGRAGSNDDRGDGVACHSEPSPVRDSERQQARQRLSQHERDHAVDGHRGAHEYGRRSHAQRRPKPGLPWLANCPNALDLDLYPFDPGNDGYLLFLGRMSPDKGAHRAIEVARAAGVPLRLAGKCRERFEQDYFEAQVKPGLGDGIEYLGEVSHTEKVELLQRARTTIFPIDWEEPFGLVMIESMACGTPVIATNHGAVPEVIENGRSGIIVEHYREMVDALERADALDPRECRRYVEERFSPERMVAEYVAAYEAAIAAPV